MAADSPFCYSRGEMVVRSPFVEPEQAAGAVFQTYGGLELPEKFTDAMAECEAARAACVLFDFSFRARLRATGPDRASFLHNLLSNDVAALRPGRGCWATLLTEHSRVVADLNVLRLDDALLLDLDVRFRDRARQHLEKYLIADEVELSEPVPDETTLGVHGPRAEAALSAATGENALPGRPLDHVAAEIAGQPVRIVRTGWIGEPGFDVFLPRQAAASVWRAALVGGEPAGLRPAGTFALNVLRLEAGIPWLGVDFDESHLVLEAGLDRAISLTKGCYLGQETVERVSARGHVNRRLVGLRLDADRPPRSGARIIRDGAEVGHVTSAAFSPMVGAAIGLGYVKRDAANPGTPVEVEGVAAEVVVLPFVRRDR